MRAVYYICIIVNVFEAKLKKKHSVIKFDITVCILKTRNIDILCLFWSMMHFMWYDYGYIIG